MLINTDIQSVTNEPSYEFEQTEMNQIFTDELIWWISLVLQLLYFWSWGMYNASLPNTTNITAKFNIPLYNTIRICKMTHFFFFSIHYISKAIALGALCIFQPCVSALFSDIDFTPEAKLFWHSILQPWTRVKKCESLFCTMVLFLFHSQLMFHSVMLSEWLAFKHSMAKYLQEQHSRHDTYKSYRTQSQRKLASLKT